MVRDGEMLEWAVVHGRAKYGTPRGPVERPWPPGGPLLEIDLQGARQVRESDARGVVRLPRPALVGRTRAAARRPRHRGEEEREARLSTARVELAGRASSMSPSSTTMSSARPRNSYH
jgi:guanylate kinase